MPTSLTEAARGAYAERRGGPTTFGQAVAVGEVAGQLVGRGLLHNENWERHPKVTRAFLDYADVLSDAAKVVEVTQSLSAAGDFLQGRAPTAEHFITSLATAGLAATPVGPLLGLQAAAGDRRVPVVSHALDRIRKGSEMLADTPPGALFTDIVGGASEAVSRIPGATETGKALGVVGGIPDIMLGGAGGIVKSLIPGTKAHQARIEGHKAKRQQELQALFAGPGGAPSLDFDPEEFVGGMGMKGDLFEEYHGSGQYATDVEAAEWAAKEVAEGELLTEAAATFGKPEGSGKTVADMIFPSEYDAATGEYVTPQAGNMPYYRTGEGVYSTATGELIVPKGHPDFKDDWLPAPEVAPEEPSTPLPVAGEDSWYSGTPAYEPATPWYSGTPAYVEPEEVAAGYRGETPASELAPTPQVSELVSGPGINLENFQAVNPVVEASDLVTEPGINLENWNAIFRPGFDEFGRSTVPVRGPGPTSSGGRAWGSYERERRLDDPGRRY